MEDLLAVRRTETESDAARQGESALDGQGAVVEQVAEIFSLDVLHSDEGRTILGLVEIENLDDVGVMKLGSGKRLTAEALEEGRILVKFAGDEFECAQAAEQKVFGEIDGAHAAAAEETLDAVLSADDGAGIEVAGGDEQSAVVFAMGVVTGVGRGAERTSFHRLDSPFKTLP
jgi:hypothetical protein